MAKTAKGQKYNRVPGYTREVDGKKQKVKPHSRSNPRTSKGKKK
jgi:hypothetical protein